MKPATKEQGEVTVIEIPARANDTAFTVLTETLLRAMQPCKNANDVILFFAMPHGVIYARPLKQYIKAIDCPLVTVKVDDDGLYISDYSNPRRMKATFKTQGIRKTSNFYLAKFAA